ncbi:hypothetical protein BU26DRAFT_472901 [Trematosphaeria pertusa]|uniref:Essential protein Yae1 N-terminal domain-containing protein n=1 Tax=Trematosphaeria pertusa TaxID=390896 RepID=A0A6A6J2Y1_9PLEO|nr:uncharacterized protein BU26DRAFT_472901 [Trematosphaeria pertusa]KAF2256572.1 hypothetical protein BU26DRAFT_472901 [Trematosphaeria pertusa]
MAQPSATHPNIEDPFDHLLTLEDTLYTSAYQLGAADGARAGRIEGRLFGLEKGFEKYAALGNLHGRAVVWGSRLPSSTKAPAQQAPKAKDDDGEKEPSESDAEEQTQRENLPPLPANERLKKHIHTLHALTDPPTFSTLNTEDAVADFDDRFKRGGAKTKIIERIINEPPSSHRTSASPSGEDRSPRKGRGVRVNGEVKKKGGEDSMEDFVGSRFLS